VELFQAQQKNQLPVAIIQNGTTADEKIGIGVVDTILEIVENQQLTNPAIIIFGEVVKHRQSILEIQQQYAKELIV
jgi:uroporphyrin-III C-methyltransferase